MNMIEFISQPWPWYVTGPLLGLLVPLTLIFLNKPFGISSTFRDMCAMCMPNTSIEFFKYDWKARLWNMVFAIGVVLGAVLVIFVFPNNEMVEISESTKAHLQESGISDLKGLVPYEIFSWENLTSPVTLILLCVGGFLVGFGTRYAGGCTSGHAIMGMSSLSLPSLVAVMGFFTGGLIMTWLILPHILKLL
jgi:uncharacterized membrane protein YedE/YeeE